MKTYYKRCSCPSALHAGPPAGGAVARLAARSGPLSQYNCLLLQD
tara:strand:+ start:834 stop:968 length:135 start_codon:yes stop_codon:yes gene_type:complete